MPERNSRKIIHITSNVFLSNEKKKNNSWVSKQNWNNRTKGSEEHIRRIDGNWKCYQLSMCQRYCFHSLWMWWCQCCAEADTKAVLNTLAVIMCLLVDRLCKQKSVTTVWDPVTECCRCANQITMKNWLVLQLVLFQSIQDACSTTTPTCAVKGACHSIDNRKINPFDLLRTNILGLNWSLL